MENIILGAFIFEVETGKDINLCNMDTAFVNSVLF